VDLKVEGLDGLNEFGKGDLISNVIEKALLNLTISRVTVMLEVPVRFKDRLLPPAVLDLNDEVLIELADFEGKINGTDQRLDKLLIDLAVDQEVTLEEDSCYKEELLKVEGTVRTHLPPTHEHDELLKNAACLFLLIDELNLPLLVLLFLQRAKTHNFGLGKNPLRFEVHLYRPIIIKASNFPIHYFILKDTTSVSHI
jgi:hypothetical protein